MRWVGFIVVAAGLVAAFVWSIDLSPSLLPTSGAQKIISSADVTSIKRLELVLHGTHIVLDRSSDGWSLAGSSSETVSPEKINKVLSALSEVQVLQAFTPEHGLDEYGLASPELKVIAQHGRGTFGLELGNASPYLNGRFVRVVGTEEIALASNGLFEELKDFVASVEEERAKVAAVPSGAGVAPDAPLTQRLLNFDPIQVTQAIVTGRDRLPVRAVRMTPGWSVNDKPGDQVFIESFLKKLSALRLEPLPDGTNAPGFESPSLQIEIETNKKEHHILLVGAAIEIESSGETFWFTRADTSDLTFLMPQRVLRSLAPSAESLQTVQGPLEELVVE